MRFLAPLALIASMLAIAVAPAGATSGITWFKTPTKNIYCAWFHDGSSKPFLRCDVSQLSHPAPKPRGCQFDWGRSFGMTESETHSADARPVGFMPNDLPQSNWQPRGFGAWWVSCDTSQRKSCVLPLS